MRNTPTRTGAAFAAALIAAAGCGGGGGAAQEPAAPATAPAATEPAPSTTGPAGCWDTRRLVREEGWELPDAQMAYSRARYLEEKGTDPCEYETFEALTEEFEHRKAIEDAPHEAGAAERRGEPPEAPAGAAPAGTDPGAGGAEETGEPAEVFAEEGELGIETVELQDGEPDEPPEPPPDPEQPEARDCAASEDDDECERLGDLVRGCLDEGKTEAECGIVGDNPAPTGTIIDYGSNEHGEEAHGHPAPLAVMPPASGTVHGVLEDLEDPDADGPWGDARMTVPLAIEPGDEFLGDEYQGARLRGRVTRLPRQYGDGPGRWTVYMCWRLTPVEAGYDAFREEDGRFRLNTRSGFSVPDNPCPPEPQ